MKTFTKAKAKSGKGKATVIDGRQNPGQFDRAKTAAFKADAGVAVKGRKLPPKVAQQIHSTPMRHQSGKGTRGTRESLNGTSKTGVIRWLAHSGYDIDTAKRIIGTLFVDMTPGVFAKHFGYGLQGENVPEMSAESIAVVKRLAK